MPDDFKLTLSNSKLAELAAGLAALDGLRVKGELEPFLFCPELTWLVADWQTALEPAVSSYRKAQKSLTTQHKVTEGMAITPQNADAVAAFVAALDALNEREVEVVGLQKISRAKLNVGHDKKKEQNNIPPTVLARLRPILEE